VAAWCDAHRQAGSVPVKLSAQARYENLMEDSPTVIACFLNRAAANAASKGLFTRETGSAVFHPGSTIGARLLSPPLTFTLRILQRIVTRRR
jgi:hypothetical protein